MCIFVYDDRYEWGEAMNENSQQFRLLLTLKLRQLHNGGLEGISYDDLYRMFTTHIWKNQKPTRLSDLADQVLNIKDEDIIRWLAVESKIQGYKSTLDDFKVLLDTEEL